MHRKIPLAVLLAVLVGAVGALYYLRLSPHAKAKSLVERMHGTPIGDEWFALLRELAVTVPDPEEYLRDCPRKEHSAGYQGMTCDEKLRLARRLLSDGATELVPGIADIVKTTPPGFADPGIRRAGSHAIIAAGEAEMANMAAWHAISRMGKDAGPLLPTVVEIVEKEPSPRTEYAIYALGEIGEWGIYLAEVPPTPCVSSSPGLGHP